MDRDRTAQAADAAGSALDGSPTPIRKKRQHAERPTAAATPVIETIKPAAVQDSASLAVHAEAAPSADPTPSAQGDADSAPAEQVYHRIGHLTRTLHDALRELGYDRDLAHMKKDLPDARDRLSYIARVSGEAAEKVLNAVDRARLVQQDMSAQADSLHKRWQAVAAFANGADARVTPAGRTLVEETCSFFSGVSGQADATNAILTDIMMAQDFHDLTGQVIRKVVTLATTMEDQLVRLLLDSTPPEQRKKVEVAIIEPSLDGPVVNCDSRSDVVTDQSQVDDLLDTLGF